MNTLRDPKQTRASKAFVRFHRHERGSVLVEFALIASVLLMFLAGSIDLVFLVSAGRDLERTSAQIAAMLTTGCDDSGCMRTRLAEYRDRKANALVLYPNTTVSMVTITKRNNAISICEGNSTYIGSGTETLAMSLMDNEDAAVAVTLELTYVPFLPVSVATFATAASTKLVRDTIRVHRKSATCF